MSILILKSKVFPKGQLIVSAESLPKTLGRSAEVDIPINDKLLSRRHSKLKQNLAGHFEIVDLESMNLTIVNGKDVESSVLKTGDVLLLGETEILVEIPEDRGASSYLLDERLNNSTTADLTVFPDDRDTVSGS